MTNEQLAALAKTGDRGSRTGDCLPFCSSGCIFERARG